MRTIHILTDAADEAQEATAWYEREQPGLGRDFEAAVDAAMDLLACETASFLSMANNSG